MPVSDPVISCTIPMRVPSRANLEKSHWQRAALVSQQRKAVLGTLGHLPAPELPVTVRLTRIAPRRLDTLDNVAMSLKATKDAVASWLGADDADERITWLRCGQRKDPQRRPRYQGVRIEVWEGQARCEQCGSDVVPGSGRTLSRRLDSREALPSRGDL